VEDRGILEDQNAKVRSVIIDADGHIMEPSQMWRDYIGPSHAHKAVRVIRDAANGDKLVVNDTICPLPPRLGGVRPVAGEPIRDWNCLNDLDEYAPYDESCLKPSFDAAARIAWMNDEGIDRSILFPSLGLIWPRYCLDRLDVLSANIDAYNRWIMDFASVNCKRLVPVAMTVAAQDEHYTTDLHALASNGFRAIMLPFSERSAGTPFSKRFDGFWKEAEEIGLVVCLHKAALPWQIGGLGRTLGIPGNGSFFEHVNETLPGQMNLASLFDNCMPDRFPKLQFAFQECNAGWVPAWLERAEESLGVVRERGDTTLRYSPAEYVGGGSTFLFVVGPTEDVRRMFGYEHALAVASDYPHPDCTEQCVRVWRTLVAPFVAKHQEAVLGLNAERLFGQAI
jgi:predicted TIM-barrel fold metal-dependent hydrolase